jgi:hypothetical protein
MVDPNETDLHIAPDAASTNIAPDATSTNIVPNDIVPTNIVPNDIVPTNIVPNDIVPSDITPSAVLTATSVSPLEHSQSQFTSTDTAQFKDLIIAEMSSALQCHRSSDRWHRSFHRVKDH